jgi:CBS domain-containing protein
MISPKDWPILPADMTVKDAIRILRIVTEEIKLEHGHATPLVLDENQNLMGFVHLADLLAGIRHLYDKGAEPGGPDKGALPVRDLVVGFAGTVKPEDSIAKALNIMMDHRVALVPVMEDQKLRGVVKLSDVFGAAAAVLFAEEIPEDRERLLKRVHFHHF